MWRKHAGVLSFRLFIFFHGKENEPKETARVPLNPARRRIERVSRKLASLKQVREPGPLDPPMLGAEQREINHNFCQYIANSKHFRGEMRGFG
ncbi:MAG: hypothetical protein QNJ61_15125 [Desulfobacterales bacterium]|nr:hypothetical protein [Desulfobacterales bacterium]